MILKIKESEVIMEKKLYNEKKIEQLLSKFMDGATTLDEEALLAEYFREAESVPEEWEDFRQMFAFFEGGMEGDLGDETRQHGKLVGAEVRQLGDGTAQHRKLVGAEGRRLAWLATAAAGLLLFGLAGLWQGEDSAIEAPSARSLLAEKEGTTERESLLTEKEGSVGTETPKAGARLAQGEGRPNTAQRKGTRVQEEGSSASPGVQNEHIDDDEAIERQIRLLQAKIDSEIATQQAELYLAEYYAEQMAMGKEVSLPEVEEIGERGAIVPAIMTLIMP